VQVRGFLLKHQIEECIYFGHNRSETTVFTSATDEHAVKRHHALTTLIQQEADRRGFISFARFMGLALYAPALGYYEHAGKPIGRRGDFFTSASVGPLFGELLACHFTGLLRQLAAARPVLVEAGAHDGRLALDILTTLRNSDPELLEPLEYWVIEPSSLRRTWQQETLQAFRQRVRWFQSWTDLSSFCDTTGHSLTGIVFANELLDAFPVHRLRWDRSGRDWKELCVRRDQAEFAWVGTLPGAEVMAYRDRIQALAFDEANCPLWPRVPEPLVNALPDGFTLEVCPAALDWWEQAARVLDQGWLLTCDYGLTAGEFFAPHRRDGTVRGYHRHQLTSDLLASPGQQDLTAHVNFSAVELVGKAAGLATESLRTQGEFLTHVLKDNWPLETRPLTAEQVRQFQTLTHPQHLGRSFRVLAQSRGVSGEK
jgi:SAM-dependent MidA family methyltransferase